MAYGKGEQLEPGLFKKLLWNPDKPWKIQGTTWRRWSKKMKVRQERRRARLNPECIPEYKTYDGWEC